MDVEELVERYPLLWHMADDAAWPGIERHGLLSTTALLDLFAVDGERRSRLEASRRLTSETLTHPQHGVAVIRDQIPLREGPLEQCLVDMTPLEWYRLLNGRVFFWLGEHRVRRLLGARAYRDRSHIVVTLDTESLVAAHNESISLAPINTGSTIFDAQPRGSETFLSIDEYPFDDWRRRRGSPRDAVVELAVAYSVPDALDFALFAERRQGAEIIERVWEPSVGRPRSPANS